MPPFGLFNEKLKIKVGNHEIANIKREKLLGLLLDSGLSFDYDISKICKKASRKVCALARITSDINLSENLNRMNAFFKSQSNYCLFIWVCHSGKNNNKINRLPINRSLRIIYDVKQSSLNALLENDFSILIMNRI